jgi:CDGSH-type Zn-finger protein
MTEPADRPHIVIRRNGPILIHGAITIEKPDGEVIASEGRMALCRCGGSATKPMCDGTHKRFGFTPDAG